MPAVLKQFMAGSGTVFQELRLECKQNKENVSDEEEFYYNHTADYTKKKKLGLTGTISENISIRSKSQLEHHMRHDLDGAWTIFKLGKRPSDTKKRLKSGKKDNTTHFAIAQTDTKKPDHKWFFEVKDASNHFQSNRFTGDEIQLSKGIFPKCLPDNEFGILSRIIESMWNSPTWLAATGVRYKGFEFNFKPTHLQNKILTWKKGGDIEVDAVVVSQAGDQVLVLEGKGKGAEVFKGQIAFSYKAVRTTLMKNGVNPPPPTITPIIVVADEKYAYICWCDWDHESAITKMKIDKVYRAKL